MWQKFVEFVGDLFLVVVSLWVIILLVFVTVKFALPEICAMLQ